MQSSTAAAASPQRDFKVIGLIGTGHFFSHFYILTLPPLFPLLRDELGVSFAALGGALAALNVTTGLTQAPCGFLVDRYGARTILIAGLALFSLAIGLIGVLPGYWTLLALMALGGLGNAVFHPADYAILGASVDSRRMGRAFSIHTFGGYAGFAVAPPVVVLLTEMIGWRGALLLVALPGLLTAALMVVYGDALRDDGRPRRGGGAATDLRLLFSRPLLTAFAFFMMLSMVQGGFTGFGAAALATLYGVSLVEASVPLTVFLAASAVGVLAGGWVADRTRRHALAVAVCFVLIAAFSAPLGWLTPAFALVTVLFAAAGFFGGAVAPSRDMLVRALTPPGASGKVFGFVTTGFNVAGIIAPVTFGLVLDHASPHALFGLIAALSLLTLTTVAAAGRRTTAR